MPEHKRTSELDEVTDLDGTELLHIVKDGQNVRTTVGAVADYAAEGWPAYPVEPEPVHETGFPMWIGQVAIICAAVAALLFFILMTSPAHAAHTQDAVVYDPTNGVVQMEVFPSDDSELTDPSFNPPGMVQQRVPHVQNADPIAQAQTMAPHAGILEPGAPVAAQTNALQATNAVVAP